eukprot:COSAG06_NODE_674_length_13168_cov_694.183641_7_plen_114_part_00
MWAYASGSYTEAQTLVGHQGPVNALTFDPETKTLFSGSSDRTIKVWTYDSGSYTFQQSLQTFYGGGHSDDVNALTFDPETKTLFSTSQVHYGPSAVYAQRCISAAAVAWLPAT